MNCLPFRVMKDLDLTADERYLLAVYREPIESGWINWAIHLGALALFLWGLGIKENALMFTAFGIVIFWRLYEDAQQPRFRRATRTLMGKLEARITELEARVEQLPDTSDTRCA